MKRRPLLDDAFYFYQNIQNYTRFLHPGVLEGKQKKARRSKDQRKT